MIEGTVLLFQYLILAYFLLLNSTYILFIVLSFFEILRYTRAMAPDRIWLARALYRPVSILVPAYNEEDTITACVKTLLALRYPEYEVVVINDGSTDHTLARLIEEFRLIRVPRPVRLVLKHRPIRGVYVSVDIPHLVVVDKENGGKADALNAGVNVARYPIICTIDADSLLERHGLLRAVRRFVLDPRVIAVGGVVRVLNGSRVENGVVTEVHAPPRAIECIQAVEYTRAFLMGRTALSRMRSLMILSGAFSVVRKDMILAIQGYRDSITEDADLIVRLHRYCLEHGIPYRILYTPDPICYTQVPSDLDSLRRQRNRWHRGLVETLIYNRRMFLNPRYGVVGLWAFPYYVGFEALGPIIETVGYASVPILYLAGWLHGEFVLLFFLIAFLWTMLINIGSIILDNVLYRHYSSARDILRLCLYGIVEVLGFRQLLAFERMVAIFQIRRKGWGKPHRETIPSPSYRIADRT